MSSPRGLRLACSGHLDREGCSHPTVDTLGLGVLRSKRPQKFHVPSPLLPRGRKLNSIEFDKDQEYFATAGVTKKIKVFNFNNIMEQPRVDSHPSEREMVSLSKIRFVVYLLLSLARGVVCVFAATCGFFRSGRCLNTRRSLLAENAFARDCPFSRHVCPLFAFFRSCLGGVPNAYMRTAMTHAFAPPLPQLPVVEPVHQVPHCQQRL